MMQVSGRMKVGAKPFAFFGRKFLVGIINGLTEADLVGLFEKMPADGQAQ